MNMKALTECKWKVEITGVLGAYHWSAHTSDFNACDARLEQYGSCELRWGAKRSWIKFAKLNNFKYVTWHRLLKRYV